MSKTYPPKGLYKNCIKCNRIFYEFPYLKGKRKFCSLNCSNKYNAKKLSKKRMGKGNPMFGKHSWNYKGETVRRNEDFRYWFWKRKVHNRDKNICQECKKKFPRRFLTAHHIKPWLDFPELRFDENNGITFCRPCHNKIDPYIKLTQYR